MLNPDYRDILSAFDAGNVEYLVVGAYALAAYGLVRATGDLDLWVRPTPTNAEKVFSALAVFGAPMKDLREEDFAMRDLDVQIGVAPRRIDILTTISGVEFEEAFPNCSEVEIDGLLVPIIGCDELIKNKKSIGRPKDDADAAWMENSRTD